MTVAVISSIYGGYDAPLKQMPQSIEADWIMVTDHEGLHSTPWRTVVEPRPDVHPRLAAKVAKCLPWLYTDADTVVWMDGSCRLLHRQALEMLVSAARASRDPVSQILHPWRQCIYDEADASCGMLKYEGRPIKEQVAHYRKQGHPEMWGLWATGLIIRCLHGSWSERERLDEFGQEWLIEQVRWTYQDQLSEPPLLRQYGLTPHTLPISLHGSGTLEWRPHRDEG